MSLVSVLQSIERVVPPAFFQGLLGRATTDSPGQGSDWLTTNNAALAMHPIITFAARSSGPLGHSFVGGAKPL